MSTGIFQTGGGVNVTASRALVSDANGSPAAATTTSTEIGYVNGVTSAIQTQLDAKQARSTLTTKGDLYVATASATVVRQAVGADGTFLKADSTQTNGVAWASPAGANLSVRSVTTTDSPTSADDILVCSSNSFVITLPTAVGISGKVFRITHNGTSTSQVYTLNTTGGQTIGGSASGTIALYLNGESIEIYSNNSNYLINVHRIPPVISLNTGDPASAASGNPIIFPTTSETFSGYNTTTGRYTVPRPGWYNVTGYLGSTTGSVEVRLYLNAANNQQIATTDSNGECAFSGTVLCVAGDIIDIRPNGTLNVDNLSHLTFNRIA